MYMLRALLPLVSLISAPALAGSDDCLACCTQGGLKACPTRLRVFTEGSYATLDEDGWRVHGMWWLDCDTGARFDAQSTLVVAQPPEAGQVLGPDWPDHTCLRQDADHWSLVRCRDGQPVGAVEIQSLLRPPGQPEDRIAVPQGGANWSGVVFDMPPPPAAGACTAPQPLVDEGARRARAAAEAEARGSLQTAVNTYQAAILATRRPGVGSAAWPCAPAACPRPRTHWRWRPASSLAATGPGPSWVRPTRAWDGVRRLLWPMGRRWRSTRSTCRPGWGGAAAAHSLEDRRLIRDLLALPLWGRTR
jgi:hypothetical protein